MYWKRLIPHEVDVSFQIRISDILSAVMGADVFEKAGGIGLIIQSHNFWRWYEGKQDYRSGADPADLFGTLWPRTKLIDIRGDHFYFIFKNDYKSILYFTVGDTYPGNKRDISLKVINRDQYETFIHSALSKGEMPFVVPLAKNVVTCRYPRTKYELVNFSAENTNEDAVAYISVVPIGEVMN